MTTSRSSVISRTTDDGPSFGVAALTHAAVGHLVGSPRRHRGRPLAQALAKLEHAARVVPMDVDPAQSAKYIVNPLTGRRVNFARLFMTHPSTDERIRRLVSGEWAA